MSSDEDLFGEQSPEDPETFDRQTPKEHDANSAQARDELKENDDLFPAHDNKPFVFYTVHEIAQITPEDVPTTERIRTVGVCGGRLDEHDDLTVEYLVEHPSRGTDSKVRVDFQPSDALPSPGSTIETFGRLRFSTTNTTGASETTFVVWFWRERRGDIFTYVAFRLRQRRDFDLAEPRLARLEEPSVEF